MRLVDEYLAALESADINRMLALFADGATVSSPLYGLVPAREFYPELFHDTARSELRLRSVMVGETTTVDRRSHSGLTSTGPWRTAPSPRSPS